MKYDYSRIDQRLREMQPMINDKQRNLFYQKMLQGRVKDKNVVDIGFGTGILSLMSIDLGAKSVVAYEQDYELAEFGKKLIKLLGLEEKIEIVNERFNTSYLKGTEDVLVHEIFAEDLFGEYLYYSLKDCPIPIIPNIYKCEIFIREATNTEIKYFDRKNDALRNPIYLFDSGVLDLKTTQIKTSAIENEIFNMPSLVPLTFLEKNKIDGDTKYNKIYEYEINTDVSDFPKYINTNLHIDKPGDYIVYFKYSFGNDDETFCVTDDYVGRSWDKFNQFGNPIGLHIPTNTFNFHQSIINGKYIFTLA